MKWFVRGVALLITCSIYTLLRFSIFPYLGGAGSGLLTVVLFGLGVWFIPTRIIRRMETKKTAPLPPPPRKSHVRRERLYNFTVDGQSICIPESQFASFRAAQERIQAEQGHSRRRNQNPLPPQIVNRNRSAALFHPSTRLGISSASSCLPLLRCCPSLAPRPPAVIWKDGGHHRRAGV